MRPDAMTESSHHEDHGVPVTEAPPASTTSPSHPVPWGDGTLPATSTMSPGTMSRARIRCTPLRSARITFPISGSYSFKASMALSAFLSCKQRKNRAAGGGVARAGRLLLHLLRRQEHPNPSPGFGVHLHHGWGKSHVFFSCSEMVPAGLNHTRSWTLHGLLGLIFSFLVWEAASPTQMYFSPSSNPTSDQAADK